MVPLDRALVSYYKLSIVSMSLTEAIRPQFAVQLFRGAVSPPSWVMQGGRASELVPQGSGRATLFASSDSFSVRRTV